RSHARSPFLARRFHYSLLVPAASRSRYCQHKHFFHARRLQYLRTGRNRRARREDIINQQHALAGNQIVALNDKSALTAVAPRLCVHARAMTFGVHATHETVSVEWQLCYASQFARNHTSLIETAFTFAGFMQRHRHDNFRAVQWLAALYFMYERNQTGGQVS